MSDFSISDKIPESFSRYIVNCIDVALSDDFKRYKEEFQPETTNGVPHCIHDWINGNIVKRMPPEFRVISFNRYSWKSKMIIDDYNKIAYTIMREKGLKRIKKMNRNSPHYLQTFVSILNSELESKVEQLTLEGLALQSFSQEILDNDFQRLCGDHIKAVDGYRHCLIAFDTEKGQLSEVNAWVLDKNLDVVSECNLDEFIKPDYSKLTNIESIEQFVDLPLDTVNAGSVSRSPLVKLKKEVAKRV